jgi:hypothetical protein
MTDIYIWYPVGKSSSKYDRSGVHKLPESTAQALLTTLNNFDCDRTLDASQYSFSESAAVLGFLAVGATSTVDIANSNNSDPSS